MAGEWDRAPLDELVDDIVDRRGLTPLKLASNFVPAGYRVISAKAIKNRRVDLSADDPRFVDEATYQKWMRTPLLADDVILTSEAPLGEAAYIREPVEWCLGQRLFGIRTKKSRLHGRFLYYALQSEGVRHDLLSRATGTTAQGIRQSELRRVYIPLPDLIEQRAIAHILGTLDDKIELNLRTNETLEEMARAIFKSWFVDFDPVRAKAEGRDPGLPKHIADLFPDRFVESALGKIPAGWGVDVLDQFTEFVLGGDWGVADPIEDKTEPALCIRGADIPSLQIGGTGKMPTRFVKVSSLKKRQLNNGDLVIEISGGSPTQSTGRPVLISQALLNRLSYPLICSNFCRLLKMKTPITSKFIYLWLRSAYANDEFLQFENGTTGIKNFAFTLFNANYKLVVPPPAILEKFDQVISQLFEEQQANAATSDTLATIRDALLPRLISGELRVGEAVEQTA